MTTADKIAALEARLDALEQHSQRHCPRCRADARDQEQARAMLAAEERADREAAALAEAKREAAQRRGEAMIAACQASPHVRVQVAADARSISGHPATTFATSERVDLGGERRYLRLDRSGRQGDPSIDVDSQAWLRAVAASDELRAAIADGTLAVTAV